MTDQDQEERVPTPTRSGVEDVTSALASGGGSGSGPGAEGARRGDAFSDIIATCLPGYDPEGGALWDRKDTQSALRALRDLCGAHGVELRYDDWTTDEWLLYEWPPNAPPSVEDALDLLRDRLMTGAVHEVVAEILDTVWSEATTCPVDWSEFEIFDALVDRDPSAGAAIITGYCGSTSDALNREFQTRVSEVFTIVAERIAEEVAAARIEDAVHPPRSTRSA